MPRPKEFEPDDALEKAMTQFWAKGYHDTSIRDLVDCTGVNYYGLYSVFESKRGLFLAALDRYRDTVTAEVIRDLKQPGSLEPGLRRSFNRLFELLTAPGSRVGCMMCNTAVELAPYDSEAAAKVQAHMKLLRHAFRARLLAGQKAGELPGSRDIDALAEFLTTTAYSLGLLLRSGCSKAYLRRHLDSALMAVG